MRPIVGAVLVLGPAATAGEFSPFPEERGRGTKGSRTITLADLGFAGADGARFGSTLGR